MLRFSSTGNESQERNCFSLSSFSLRMILNGKPPRSSVFKVLGHRGSDNCKMAFSLFKPKGGKLFAQFSDESFEKQGAFRIAASCSGLKQLLDMFSVSMSIWMALKIACKLSNESCARLSFNEKFRLRCLISKKT